MEIDRRQRQESEAKFERQNSLVKGPEKDRKLMTAVEREKIP